MISLLYKSDQYDARDDGTNDINLVRIISLPQPKFATQSEGTKGLLVAFFFQLCFQRMNLVGSCDNLLL